MIPIISKKKLSIGLFIPYAQFQLNLRYKAIKFLQCTSIHLFHLLKKTDIYRTMLTKRLLVVINKCKMLKSLEFYK